MSNLDDKATDVRVTFRTHKSRVEKLERVARVHDLKIGARYSVGAAINFVVDQHKVKVVKPKKAATRGAKR